MYVGKATKRKLNSKGVYTIGDLANVDTRYIKSWLGKVGLVLHAFASGEDKSPVNIIGFESTAKSIGNSTTCPRDLESDQDVQIVLYVLAESVGARLAEQGFFATTVELSFVGTNLSFNFTHQTKLDKPTNISGELARAAFALFKEHYGHWPSPLRKIGIRGSDLITEAAPIQLDIYSNENHRVNTENLEASINHLRRRFGNKSVQRGIMYLDPLLSKLDAKKDHSVFPAGVFKEGMEVSLNGRLRNPRPSRYDSAHR